MSNLDFAYNHYMPILKTKQGERWALSGLSAARRHAMTPLLEFHSSDALSANEQVAAMCEALAVEWGTEEHIFLDLRWLQAESGDPGLISAMADAARNSGVVAVPVATVQYDQTAREQLAAEIEIDETGCLIRVRPTDLQDTNEIQALVEDLGITVADAHLLLDYQSAQMNLSFDLGQIPEIEEWRTLTVASGSFPKSLAAYALDEWFELPRSEWRAWNMLRKADKIPRMPSFGDYTTRDPGAPAKGGKPSVNIRYARASDWLCRMGGRLEDGAAPQMKEFCALLIAHESYAGANFSGGDAEYYDKSLPDTRTGGAGDWTKWAISHHLCFVADQLAFLP